MLNADTRPKDRRTGRHIRAKGAQRALLALSFLLLLPSAGALGFYPSPPAWLQGVWESPDGSCSWTFYIDDAMEKQGSVVAIHAQDETNNFRLSDEQAGGSSYTMSFVDYNVERSSFLRTFKMCFTRVDDTTVTYSRIETFTGTYVEGPLTLKKVMRGP